MKMKQFEKRINKFGWTLLQQEMIEGLHAGNIVRLTVLDEFKKVRKLIYKEFADNRNNEIDVYSKILPSLKSFVLVITMWDTKPFAVLMEDLDLSMKKSFEHLQFENKKVALTNVLNTLADLHTNESVDIENLTLPTHAITEEWRDWCYVQLNKLDSLKLDWYNPSWIELVEEGSTLFNLSQCKIKGPLVLTHGDPHLDNVFTNTDGSILFIDWEWAALGSPFRDITILLQDVYDVNLIDFGKNITISC
jgi:hypothetical protein